MKVVVTAGAVVVICKTLARLAKRLEMAISYRSGHTRGCGRNLEGVRKSESIPINDLIP